MIGRTGMKMSGPAVGAPAAANGKRRPAFFRRALASIALLAAAALILAACSPGEHQHEGGPEFLSEEEAGGFKGMVFVDEPTAPDFELVDQHGDTFRLSDHRGHPVFLFFGYTTCPDVCPTTLLDLGRVYDALEEQGVADDVRIVFVTVDPTRDTEDRLGEYMASYGREEFYGLTGPQDELKKVWQDYNVVVDRVEALDSPVGYWINHTSLIHLIDAEGTIRLGYMLGMSRDDIVNDVNLLLEEVGT